MWCSARTLTAARPCIRCHTCTGPRPLGARVSVVFIAIRAGGATHLARDGGVTSARAHTLAGLHACLLPRRRVRRWFPPTRAARHRHATHCSHRNATRCSERVRVLSTVAPQARLWLPAAAAAAAYCLTSAQPARSPLSLAARRYSGAGSWMVACGCAKRRRCRRRRRRRCRVFGFPPVLRAWLGVHTHGLGRGLRTCTVTARGCFWLLAGIAGPSLTIHAGRLADTTSATSPPSMLAARWLDVTCRLAPAWAYCGCAGDRACRCSRSAACVGDTRGRVDVHVLPRARRVERAAGLLASFSVQCRRRGCTACRCRRPARVRAG
ncbi:hypothetical protein C8J57DRAFT_173852, partial [Mycena rebaudengoi]